MAAALEALHRSKNPPLTNLLLQEKIERVLAVIENPSDKRWATMMLNKTSEQPLSSRLFELLSGLPLRFKPERLQKFCVDIAKGRNDVSHFGGAQTGVDQQLFLDLMYKTSAAIQYLYHAVILQDIGVPPHLITAWLERRWTHWEPQRVFEEVGLVEVRKPPSSI